LPGLKIVMATTRRQKNTRDFWVMPQPWGVGGVHSDRWLVENAGSWHDQKKKAKRLSGEARPENKIEVQVGGITIKRATRVVKIKKQGFSTRGP